MPIFASYRFRSTALLAALPLLAAAEESFRLRLNSLSAGSSLHLDRWGGDGGGNGFGWRRKSVLYNPPQTLAYLYLGASLALTRAAGLSVTLPFYRNAIDPYVSSRSGAPVPGRIVTGIGDLELAAPLRLGPVGLQPSLAFPWAYEARFLEPWTGLGVYRAGLSASWSPRPAHSLWAAAELVAWKPEGEHPGLVEPLDHALKAGYAFKPRLSRRLAGRAGLDLGYTSFRWAGDDPQRNWSLDPRLGLSFSPRPGHELSLSGSATLYSHQGGSPTYRTYASRRMGLGLHYGRYL